MTNQRLKTLKTGGWASLVLIAFAFVVYGFTLQPQATQKTVENVEPKKPLWVDMVTPNVAKTKDFYSALLGWQFEDKSQDGLKNYLIKNGNQVIGSIFEIKKATAAVWIPAAHVQSSMMKSRTQMLEKKGAKIAIAALNMPGRGNQVMFEGAQGEEFSLMANNSYHQNEMYSTNNGSLMGTELWADDVSKASNFYEMAFGVNITQQNFDGLPYWYFEKDGTRLAGMIKNPIENQSTQWVSYFFVDDVNTAVKKASQLGAFVAMAPSANFRNGKLAIVEDPNGALICLHSNQ